MKNYECEHVRIEGRIGTWYEIDRRYINNELYLLLEHEKYGDEAAGLLIKMPPIQKLKIIDINNKPTILIPDDYEIGETYDDIETTLEDYDISYENEQRDAIQEEVEQLRIVASRIEKIANKI